MFNILLNMATPRKRSRRRSQRRVRGAVFQKAIGG
jgi:hypothetical protein